MIFNRLMKERSYDRKHMVSGNWILMLQEIQSYFLAFLCDWCCKHSHIQGEPEVCKKSPNNLSFQTKKIIENRLKKQTYVGHPGNFLWSKPDTSHSEQILFCHLVMIVCWQKCHRIASLFQCSTIPAAHKVFQVLNDIYGCHCTGSCSRISPKTQRWH